MPAPEADRVFPGASEDRTRNSPLAEPRRDNGQEPEVTQDSEIVAIYRVELLSYAQPAVFRM